MTTHIQRNLKLSFLYTTVQAKIEMIQNVLGSNDMLGVIFTNLRTIELLQIIKTNKFIYILALMILWTNVK